MMRARTRFICVVVAAGVALAAGLLRRWGHEAPVPSGTLLVVDGVAYRERDLEAHLGEARFDDEDAARRALLELADHVLLRREAERRGRGELDDAELVGLLLDELGVEPVGEDQIAAWYQEHRERFVHPRTIRVAHLSIPRSDDDPADWARIRTLHVQAQMNKEPAAFQALLQRRVQGVAAGEVGRVPCRGEGSDALPAEVVERACALLVGELSAAFASQGRLWLVRKMADYPASRIPLAGARGEIRARVERANEREASRRLLASLREDAGVWIPEGALMALRAEHPAPRPEETGPPGVPGLEE